MDPRTEERLIEHLLQFVSLERRERMEQLIGLRTSHIRVVLEDIFQPHNASAVMRSCECFGIQHLHVVENRYKYTLNREVAMGSSQWINLHRHRDPDGRNTTRCLRELQNSGYRIVATSLDPGSIPLSRLPLAGKFALWFGTEEEGLSRTVLEAADQHVHVPMYGFTQSFNISVSAALCLYDLRTRLQESNIDWSLSGPERRAVYRLWLRNSIRKCALVERAFLGKRSGADPSSG